MNVPRFLNIVFHRVKYIFFKLFTYQVYCVTSTLWPVCELLFIVYIDDTNNMYRHYRYTNTLDVKRSLCQIYNQ